MMPEEIVAILTTIGFQGRPVGDYSPEEVQEAIDYAIDAVRQLNYRDIDNRTIGASSEIDDARGLLSDNEGDIIMTRFTDDDYCALFDYVNDIVEDGLDQIEQNTVVPLLVQQFPNYDPDWCKEDFDSQDKASRDAVVNKITEYLMHSLFYYYDEDEDENI